MRRHSNPAGSAAAIPPLAGTAYAPLYRRVYETIAGMIAAGAWRPGDSLPAETDIARAYKVAAGTVRKAMDELVGDGLIERRQGLGTFVHRPNFDNSMLRFFRFRDAAGDAFVPESQIVTCRLEPCHGRAAEVIELQDGMAIHLLRRRQWDGVVRLIEDIHLPARRFSRLLDVGPQEIGPLLYPAYERHCGQVVFSIEEKIDIREASPGDAAMLGLEAGSLAFHIERIARDATGAAIEWRVSRGDARQFRYEVTVAAGGQ
jgi:GntR family transcriptional regulator